MPSLIALYDNWIDMVLECLSSSKFLSLIGMQPILNYVNSQCECNDASIKNKMVRTGS